MLSQVIPDYSVFTNAAKQMTPKKLIIGNTTEKEILEL